MNAADQGLMTVKARLLSKSRFKLGTECPTKLYFTGKAEYGNTKLDNAFLEALAEGGFQVGELAKLYHEGGVEVSELDVEKAVAATAELLKRDTVTLFEPAIQFGDLLVRVDVLVKKGSTVELIEVKAKSFDPSEESPFYNKTALKKGNHQLSSEWEPYLLDIAFQKYVAQRAFPEWKISAFLMLADKTAKASIDGINQRFFLSKDSRGRPEVTVAAGTSAKDLGERLLVKVSVDSEVGVAHAATINNRSFAEHVEFLAGLYKNDQMAAPIVGSQCKGCEFRIGKNEKAKGLKSAFEMCWQAAAHLRPSDFDRPMIFDIWNFRGSQALVDSKRYFIDQVVEDDISPTSRKDGDGLSATERQWLQVTKTKTNDRAPFLDVDGMLKEMETWVYPLHFIDFETTMMAIPFHKGRRPYEQIAFQFSHHIVTEDGAIEHKNEYINRERGKFPNFEFVRQLRKALSSDSGTIFRFAAHENTVLCQIHGQLQASKEADRDELMSWIETITKSTGGTENAWVGARNMVDMCDLVKKYFYHPLTSGSNSIKKVLPAILQSSQFLQNTYGLPVYGAPNGIKSKNFQNWQWIKKDDHGNVLDPYKLLPPIFTDLELSEMDALITEGSIADGGAAMTAYARMQFTEMTEAECDRVAKALLKYCELDTFAMVLIFQHWQNALRTYDTQTAPAARKRLDLPRDERRPAKASKVAVNGRKSKKGAA